LPHITWFVPRTKAYLNKVIHNNNLIGSINKAEIAGNRREAKCQEFARRIDFDQLLAKACDVIEQTSNWVIG
jgi:hypothetical protein